MIPLKAYLALGLATMIALAAWRYNYLVNDRNEWEAKSKSSDARAEQIQAGANMYRDAVEKQNIALNEYQNKLEDKVSENNRKRAADSNGSHVVYIKGECKTTADTDTSPAQTIAIPAADVRSNIWDIRQGIILLEANYALCLSELNRRN